MNNRLHEQQENLSSLLSQGLWHNNSALVQLLGLCPLLAVSTNAVQALGLGLATTLILICTSTVVSVLRHAIPHSIRIPIYVMIIASVTSSVQLLMQAFAVNLYQALGIFIPLIVTNCIVIGRAEAFAIKHRPLTAAADGLFMGLGASSTLLLLGSLRELLGSGALFQGAEQLLGAWARGLCLEVVHLDHPFLLATLPPGAFLGLGLLLALKQYIDQRHGRRRQKATATPVIVSHVTTNHPHFPDTAA